MQLEGKSAIITGAASGIGKCIALVYADAGCNVAIADLNKQAADATAAEINARGGGNAIGVAMDVTNEDAVNAGVAATVEALAASICSSAMLASRSCIRSKTFHSPSGRRCWPSISMGHS